MSAFDNTCINLCILIRVWTVSVNVGARYTDEVFAKLDAQDIDSISLLRELFNSVPEVNKAAETIGVTVGQVLSLRKAFRVLDDVHGTKDWHD